MSNDQSEQPASVTDLLLDWRQGRGGALEELMERVYPQLRRIAEAQFAGERREHTLEPVAVVNEAFLRLVEAERIDWQSRGHFFAVASRLMRRVLVDHARGRHRKKRFGTHVTLQEWDAVQRPVDVEVLALERALEKLESQGLGLECEVVQLRFFAGLTIEQTATALTVGHATVERAWRFARAYLLKELDSGPRKPGGG